MEAVSVVGAFQLRSKFNLNNFCNSFENYIPSRALTLFSSTLATSAMWVKFLFCFLVFFVRMWLLKACFLFTFPVPVSVKRFFEPELVFIFGIVKFDLVNNYLSSNHLDYFFLSGAIIMIILLPSSLGICSALPYSSSSTAKRRRSFSP